MTSSWTPAHDDQLSALRAQGRTYRQIGAVMGLSVPMVCHRWRDLLRRRRRDSEAPPPLHALNAHLRGAIEHHARRGAAMVRAGMALDAAANAVRQEAPDCRLTVADIVRVMDGEGVS